MDRNTQAMHEAAHAFMAYYLGFTLDEVVMTTADRPSYTRYTTPDVFGTGPLDEAMAVVTHPAVTSAIDKLNRSLRSLKVRSSERNLKAAFGNHRIVSHTDRSIYRHRTESEILVVMAGPVVESIMWLREYPRRYEGAPDDHARISELIGELAVAEGELACFHYSGYAEQASPYYSQVYEEYLWLRTRFELCKPHVWAPIDALAAALLEMGHLSGKEATLIIQAASVRGAYNRPW